MKTVERGAALLDEVYGPEWDTLIDENELDLSSPCNCVLGQIERKHPRLRRWRILTRIRDRYLSPYWIGIERLDLREHRQSAAHGFTHGRASFVSLTDAWRRLIRRRRKDREAALPSEAMRDPRRRPVDPTECQEGC